MKFSRQLLASCILGLTLGFTSGVVKAETNLRDFNLEPFKVVCIKNVLYLVWEHRDLAVSVKGVFCSNYENMVEILKPSELPVVTTIL